MFANPTTPRLRRARKNLGQHFLKHPQIAERIVRVSGVGNGDTVLEVGPGRGILTRALLASGARVVAVEADAALVEGLAERFASGIATKQLALVHGDIRAFNFAQLSKKYAVVANIPYYLTGELIRLLLEAKRQPASMTLLVQKEVAERIARSKKESLLSLSVKAFGTPKYEFTVPRGAFIPAPKVDSAALSIKNISRRHFVSARDESRFFALIRAGFAHKRKLLSSNLAGLVLPAALRAARIPEKTRAEELSLNDWLTLARAS